MYITWPGSLKYDSLYLRILKMSRLDEIKLKWGKKELVPIKTVTMWCSKSCMECLTCSHNGNSQISLLLASLFNQWREVRDIKWSDVNWMCDLK